jgi:hypothetical protein
MGFVLVPDLTATVEIDPIAEKLRGELTTAPLMERGKDDKITQEDFDAAKAAHLARLNEQLEAYTASTDPKPSITIGYISPSKMTAIDNARFAASQNKTDVEGMLNALSDSTREMVRWGVRGHDIEHAPFKSHLAKWRGQDHAVATDDMLDIYERNGWLHAISGAIQIYNRLGDSKKKK